MTRAIIAAALCALVASATGVLHGSVGPGARVLLDAHNCYPYNGRWADRIDRALSAGTPLAIEQDLVWFRDPATGRGRSLVAHDDRSMPALGLTGAEPAMRDYFFERVRPIVEQALRDRRQGDWPIITLNLDFKTEEPEHLAAVWSLLTEYRSWLTTARRGRTIDDVQPLQIGPILVLTGDSDAQRAVFHDAVGAGEPLLVFGATKRAARTNYHRWMNFSWKAVEPEGQPDAGAWTADDEARLRGLVRAAHDADLWIRFYTLDGFTPGDTSNGWLPGYNFGSLAAARERWRAAIRAGVDYVATDQYELFRDELRSASFLVKQD